MGASRRRSCDDGGAFPVLEVPEWMFDSGVCTGTVAREANDRTGAVGAGAEPA
jgi:hypothetical protein